MFKTKVSEITSISLEHKINKIEEDLISGVFLISGDYKMTEGSIIREKFNFDVNFDIALDNRYDTSNILIDIDDFTYRVINEEILKVNIDLYIEGDVLNDDVIVVTKPIIDDIVEVSQDEIKEEIQEVNREEVVEKKEMVDKSEIRKKDEETNNIVIDNSVILEDNIFGNINDTETYATYYVYIVKEDDTIDKVMEKYNVSRDDISIYNDTQDIKPGDKIIIPTCNNG